MKYSSKNFKKYSMFVLLVMVSLLLTGCVKVNYSMSINKDKSMNLVIISAFDKSLTDSTASMENSDFSSLEDQGFYIEDYEEDNMKGYKFSKSFDNIDDISDEGEVISNLQFNNKDNNAIFQVKKGFLKNTYTAKFESSSSDNSEDSTNDDLFDGDISEELGDLSEAGISGMDLKFVVNVPYKALSSNATETSNGGKTLTWDMLKLTDGNTIDFKFEIYNMTNVYIVCCSFLILSGLICYSAVNAFKKKDNTNNSNNKYNIQD